MLVRVHFCVFVSHFGLFSEGKSSRGLNIKSSHSLALNQSNYYKLTDEGIITFALTCQPLAGKRFHCSWTTAAG